jgi:hypothetical protein
MPSWEEVVSWVSVGSSSGALRESSQRWQSVFSHLETLQSDVNRLQRDIERASWAGHTADALTDHLYKVATAVRGIIDGHRRIVGGLQDAAGHLDTAVSAIRVPEYVKPEATQRQATFASSGQLTEYRTNEFYERMPWISMGYDPTGGEAEASANLGQRFWLAYNNYMATADSTRQELMKAYATDANTIGTGNKVASPQLAGAAGAKAGAGAGAGAKTTGSDALSTGISNPSMPMAGMTPSMSSAPLSTAGLDPGTLPPGLAGSGLSSADLGSSGLAGSGLGASGLGLSGLDSSGLPKGGGGLAGLKPLGAGGAGMGGFGGIGPAGLGPSVSPEEMIGDTPGGAAAGRVAGGAAAGLTGAGGSAMGMMPGGAGAGMPTDTSGQTETKLIEDDKYIFGPRVSDRDLPGDVIG